MKKKDQDPVVSLRMPQSIRKSLLKRAKLERRTFTSMILFIIDQALNGKQ